MRIKGDLHITNLPALEKGIRGKLMPILTDLVKDHVDNYLDDLQKHMGRISGRRDYVDGNISWKALDEESLEDGPKFWYESGAVKQAITVNMQIRGNRAQAFVGIRENSPVYEKALWNELGFTPEDGDRLIRRPLFFPLSFEHEAILNDRLLLAFKNKTMRIRI